MPRKQPEKLPNTQRTMLLDTLWTTVSTLKNKKETELFFKDLLSETEAIMLARRIQIARMLVDGKSYEKIRKELQISPLTISHVQQWMQGGFGGYQNIIPRLEKTISKKNKRKRNIMAYRGPLQKIIREGGVRTISSQ